MTVVPGRPGDEPSSVWIAAAAQQMAGESGLQATLDAAARLAVLHVGGAQSAAVSVVGRGIEATSYAGRMAATCERLQRELGEGAGLSAVREGGTVMSPSVAYDQRWPRWGRRVVEEAGASSVLSVCLATGGGSSGWLSLHATDKAAFSDQDRADGVALAAHVAIAVAVVRRADALAEGLATRSLIGQAMGIVMERYGVSSAVAFAMLTRLSSSREVKIRVLADQIVTTRQLPAD